METKECMGEKHNSIQEIINDENISKSNEEDEIFTGVIKGEISLEDIET